MESLTQVEERAKPSAIFSGVIRGAAASLVRQSMRAAHRFLVLPVGKELAEGYPESIGGGFDPVAVV